MSYKPDQSNPNVTNNEDKQPGISLQGNTGEEEKNPWITLNSKLMYESPWISLTQFDVINPAGKPGIYGKVHFKNLAMGILPLDEQYNTWIVGQYRFPTNHYSWEIVEGGGAFDMAPLDSAKKELLEETGIRAGKWTKLMEMHLSNSATDELAIVYIARELSFHTAEPEETEVLQVRKIPFSQLYEMVMQGKIMDAISVAAVLKTKIWMDEGKL